MLAILPLLLLAAAPPAETAPAPMPAPAMPAGTATLAPDAEARWVPFTLTPGNQVRFDLALDGRTVSAILDTGVSYSVLARRYTAQQHLAVRAMGNATAIGGAVAVGWVDTREIVLGGLMRRGGGVAVADLPAVATGGTVPVDMLVGRDLIGTAALDLDYPNHRFRLIPSGRMPFAGPAVPLAISPERQVYVTRVTLGDHVLSPMIVDTGDGSAMTLSQASWHLAVPAGARITTAIAYGLAGPITIDLAIVPELRVGDMIAREVEVRAEAAGGFSEAIGVAGRIGSGFLGRYRVLMDPVAGRMILSPGPDADRAPQRSTSGLLLTLQPGRLKVVHVMRGSPAAAAGWRDGDLICSVDGRAIDADYATGGFGAWSAGPPGRVMKLGQCDGPVRSLTLATFY
ncbi:MAG: aspartyl protease family protein [Janthinobacterium lividum]